MKIRKKVSKSKKVRKKKTKYEKTREKDIKSKSGILYRLEFSDKKQECRVTCLSATCAFSFLKREIHYAMDPLNLEIVSMGIDDITYKCPSYMNQKVIKRIREC